MLLCFFQCKFHSWNRENPKIEQSDLDGTNRVVLLRAPAVNLPNSLAISHRYGELCYADAGTQKVECIEPYRGTTRTVATGLSYPFGLAATNERLYWTDWTTYVTFIAKFHVQLKSLKWNELIGTFVFPKPTAKRLKAAMSKEFDILVL